MCKHTYILSKSNKNRNHNDFLDWFPRRQTTPITQWILKSVADDLIA